MKKGSKFDISRGATKRLGSHRRRMIKQLFTLPGRGRVPLQITESGGKNLSVSITTDGHLASSAYSVCKTPCLLQIRPGSVSLTLNPGPLFSSSFQFKVPPAGLDLIVRHTNWVLEFLGAGVLTVGASGLVGALFSLPATSGFRGELTRPEVTFIVALSSGLVAAGVGLLMVWLGHRKIISQRPRKPHAARKGHLPSH